MKKIKRLLKKIYVFNGFYLSGLFMIQVILKIFDSTNILNLKDCINILISYIVLFMIINIIDITIDIINKKYIIKRK